MSALNVTSTPPVESETLYQRRIRLEKEEKLTTTNKLLNKYFTKLSEISAIQCPDVNNFKLHVALKDPDDGPYAILGETAVLCNEYYTEPHRYLLIYGKGNTIASFSLRQLPGCCGILTSYHAKVYDSYRNKGVGTLLNNMRMEIAKIAGYTVMIATDMAGNTKQRKILQKNAWKDIFSFRNSRTGNLVYVSVVTL